MPGVARLGDVDSDGDTLISASATVYAGSASFSPTFRTPSVTLPAVYDLEFVRGNLQQVSRYAEFDDPESIGMTPGTYPPDILPITHDGNVKQESNVEAEERETPDLGDCNLITLPINYNTRLSQNYTINNLSTGALFPHRIRAQVGLTEQEIVCNLEALALNILEPIRQQFGPFRINSGFRVGSGRSQHNRGCAVDIQEPSWSNKKHLEVGEWVVKNLPFDAIILEHGRSVWLHISFDRTKSKQRGLIQTMYGGKFSNGFKLYY